MVKMPKCGECGIYPSLFCRYKDTERQTCVFAPLVTDIMKDITGYFERGSPIDMQEICVKHIETLANTSLSLSESE